MLYNSVKNKLYAIFFKLIYGHFFKKFGNHSKIVFPLSINGMKNISIGKDVYVAYRSWLAALPLTGEAVCELVIGKGTCIGNFNHIYATKSIVIGENVLTADKVYISDNLHEYEDITFPIIHQPIKQIASVVIGDGTWIGENACVIGVKIGKNCVIGANSTVTKDIPDYCVAVGSPAKVIKRYCLESKMWYKTDENANFIKRVNQ
jgi:acetyltransferase-like isoleucine patch superfamily enzyme